MSNEDVRALVFKSAQEQDLDPLDLQVNRKIRVRSHTGHPATAHYHASSQDKSAEYCIKLFDTTTTEKQKFFQRETRLLEELSQTGSDRSTAMTPAVLLTDAKAGLLVMEWLNGYSMKSSLMLATYSSDRRNRLLRLSGQWLRHFHEAYGIQRKPAEASIMMNRMQANIDGMTDQCRNLLLADKSIMRSLALLRERAPAMDGISVEWGLYHQDFTPSNLIVCHKGTVVRGIDFGKASDDAPVSFDIASFIVRTCDVGSEPLFAGTSAIELRLKGTIEAVLNGYSRQLSDADRSWILWCLLYWCVTKNGNYYGTVRASKRGIPKRMISYLKWRKVRRLMLVVCDLVQ
ncbi:phosphotransferase [Anderseniella sp. Alg231-50]|uniref:phosphotransferase n=1 Tax=Anderseniella sp. Alg231-50 TaxID=1922226 RepID=UPI000D55230B